MALRLDGNGVPMDTTDFAKLLRFARVVLCVPRHCAEGACVVEDQQSASGRGGSETENQLAASVRAIDGIAKI